MVGTPVSLSVTSSAMLPCQPVGRPVATFQNSFGLSFLLAFACLTLITTFVPERPTQLASLCQKHNSAIACEVW